MGSDRMHSAIGGVCGRQDSRSGLPPYAQNRAACNSIHLNVYPLADGEKKLKLLIRPHT